MQGAGAGDRAGLGKRFKRLKASFSVFSTEYFASATNIGNNKEHYLYIFM